MGYHIEFSDIVSFKGDAIVNSLGVNGSVYGRLCKNIIQADKSNTIKNIIDNKINNKIGDVFVTPSGDLICNNVIHIVTPFKKIDDSNLSLLKKAYKDIIDLAIKLGYKTLALPFIGTGANGYTDNQAYEAIEYACEELIAKEEKQQESLLDITIIGYLKKERVQRRERNIDCCDGSIEYANIIMGPSTGMMFTPGNTYRHFVECANAMTEVNEEEFIYCSKPYKYPYDFILDYFAQTGKNDKDFPKIGIDPKKKYKLSTRYSYTKITIYRLAYICQMTMSQLVQFMFICEASFNPNNKLDVFMMNYFRGCVPHIHTRYQFSAVVKKYTDIDIFKTGE